MCEIISLIMLFASTTAFAGEKPFVEYKPMGWNEFYSARLKEYFPSEISDFIVKYSNCNHWRGEEAYNTERALQIKNGINENCPDIKPIEAALAEKYKGAPKLIELNSLKDEINTKIVYDYSFIWNDPKKESVAISKYIEAEAQNVLRTVPLQMKEYDVIKKTGGDTENIGGIAYRLKGQTKYLQKVLKEKERLHPITLRKILQLSKDEDFLRRATGGRKPPIGQDK